MSSSQLTETVEKLDSPGISTVSRWKTDQYLLPLKSGGGKVQLEGHSDEEGNTVQVHHTLHGHTGELPQFGSGRTAIIKFGSLETYTFWVSCNNIP